MVRSDEAAADSLAAILARNRLGIAIAAMIRIIGTSTMLMYPMTRPAVALPCPANRPALLRMLDWARWPSITAGIPARTPKHSNERIPRMRLAVALPSTGRSPGTVLGRGCIAGDGAIVGAGVARGGGALAEGVTGEPQFAQLVEPSGTLAPHTEQNISDPLVL